MPRARVPVEPLAPQDGWCDASGHKSYNARKGLQAIATILREHAQGAAGRRQK